MTKPGRHELRSLTGVRYFAAVWVVFYHYAPTTGPRPVTQLISYGYLAVGFFFVLSGFVLAYSYLNERGELRGNATTFGIARFARIYPAYFLSYLLCAWQLATKPPLNALASSALYLAVLQTWTPWTAHIWNYPAWSLGNEGFFYALFPWIGGHSARWGRSPRWTPLIILLLLFLSEIPSALVYALHPRDHHWGLFATTFPVFRIPQFVAGILLLGIYSRRELSSATVPAWLALAAILLTTSSGLPRPLVETASVAAFTLLIYALANGAGVIGNLLSRPAMVLLGDASYAVYILQRPVADAMGLSNPHSWTRMLLYVAVLTLVSIATLYWIERPARKFIMDRWTRSRQSKPALREATVTP